MRWSVFTIAAFMRTHWFSLIALVGCSSSAVTPIDGRDASTADATTDAPAVVDAGAPDAGTPDAGTPDVGTPDVGTPDVGTPDAGTPDVGTPDVGTPDVGTPDVGTPDAGAATGISGDDYCRALGVGTTCAAAEVQTCGVCIARSTNVFARTSCDDTQRREYCHTGTMPTPDLGCYAPGSRPTAGTSQSVTLWGYVRVFGNGGDSQHLRVSVYRVNSDGTPGDLVGAAVSDIAAPGAATEEVYSPSRDRVLFARRAGGYQIANVPTETELLVVTEGDPADTQAAGLWSHRVYSYDIVVANADVGAVSAPTGITGARTARYLPLAVSNTDWTALPATSTLTAGIAEGRGMILGEVHDCGDVRLANATVESAPRRRWDGPVVYFNENDTSPLPDLSRDMRGTSLLGTFMLLDMDPGAVRVAALGRSSAGASVHLGSRRVRAYAGAVTWVTLRGLRPSQVTAP